MATLTDEIARRRTFAIISHPDAGKTTLTEKLLLFGGAIQMAGEVKARGERRRARSDWMAIERERGISVSSAVMTFEHDGLVFNLLDTPGHQDFSEDTYRTLTAVDSAVMVIDAARGIEEQTKKLFEVCRLRDVPIVTFINKLDRESRDPFDLIDEIEQTLALDTTPASWPIGTGRDFLGTYDLFRNALLLFDRNAGERAIREQISEPIRCSGLDDPQLAARLPAPAIAALKEQVEMAQGLCPPFKLEAFRQGHLTPVFFGSALNNFGVRELLRGVAELAPPPRPQPAEPHPVQPEEKAVSGFVFKVQANIDPQHRDRIAFVRMCSGRFQRGMKLKNLRTERLMAVQNPVFFLARDRNLAEEAWPGDILGIPNHGTLRIGDTLTEGAEIRVTGLPSFAPELLRRVRIEDPMKQKHLRHALTQLADEGVTRVFKPTNGSDWVIGVVGALQLDVLQARLAAEYSLATRLEPAPYEAARWLDGDRADLDRFRDRNGSALAEDHDGIPVFLARNAWDLRTTIDEWPAIRFSATREQH
ncbi:MAG TPA: peptide chain release factor 3 [Stellaceae bacterium]|jgi:peptide chain release factor 3|nr:peptide chain release factor 3 [Stellaceae bacterium]